MSLKITPEFARRHGLSVARATPPSEGDDRRNRGERLYAEQVLEAEKRAGLVRDYWFEGIKLRIGDNCHITPDYLVILADWTVELREVKGRKGDGPFMREDALVKLKAVADKYPFRLCVVWPTKGGKWARRDLR